MYVCMYVCIRAASTITLYLCSREHKYRWIVLPGENIMYVLIGKEKCNRCNMLKNLLDEKGIQYNYLDACLDACLDVSKIPLELLTYLRMYSNTYPTALGVKYFSTFNETLEYFNDI